MKFDFFGHFSSEFSILGNKLHFFHGLLDGWFEVQTDPDMDFLKLTYKNAAVLQHFWAKSIQRFYLQLGVCYSTVYYAPLFIK